MVAGLELRVQGLGFRCHLCWPYRGLKAKLIPLGGLLDWMYLHFAHFVQAALRRHLVWSVGFRVKD